MRAQIGSKRELIGRQTRELPMSQGYLDPLIVECTLGTHSLAAEHQCCIVEGLKAGFVESFIVASTHLSCGLHQSRMIGPWIDLRKLHLELNLFDLVAYQLILDNFDSLMANPRIFDSQCLSLRKFIAGPLAVAAFNFSTKATALCFKDDLN